jgi:hypothetical protein
MGRTKHRPCVPQDLPEIPKASLAPAATAPLSSGKTLTTATLAQQDEMLAKQVKTQSSKRYLLPPRLSTKTAAMQDFPAEVDSEQAEVPPSPTELDCPTCELKLPSTYIQVGTLITFLPPVSSHRRCFPLLLFYLTNTI